MRKIIISAIILILMGCDTEKELLSSKNDSYKQYPKGTSFNPEIFNAGFIEGHEETENTGRKHIFNVVHAGDIKLSSGKLVISEPLYLYDQQPVDFDIKPGAYPVFIAEAVIYMDSKVVDKRNALVRIKLDKGVAVEWKYIWSFGVDGGTGGYIDYSTIREIVDNKDSDSFSEKLLDELENIYKIIVPFEENYKSYHQYVNLRYKNSNLIAFSTGYGDGAYHSFAGIDAKGKMVEILTDFAVIHWDPENHLTEQKL